jgi:hypothetical protein
MENKTVTMEENVMYYYYVSGVKYWTPNPAFAGARAIFYDNGNVYVEKIS